MVWGSFLRAAMLGGQGCVIIWNWLVLGLLVLEVMVTKVAARFALTEEEKEIVVVDRKEALAYMSSRVFLVGRVLSNKPVNKEGFKRQMRNLWRPKVNVVVSALEGNRFVFGFNSMQERTTILRGGPWLYNKQYLLVLGEVDNLAFLERVPLMFQEFWVQFKGIPIGFMTHPMVKFLGNILGEYVITDQSRMKEQFGSILRVRVRLDVRKPLRRFITVQLEGRLLKVDARYEKLPLTCFLCGMMDHVDDHCECFTGAQVDDRDKPYGKWFQTDVVEKDYVRPVGRRFGLDS